MISSIAMIPCAAPPSWLRAIGLGWRAALMTILIVVFEGLSDAEPPSSPTSRAR